MPQDYLMNIASTMFLICYIPEFYANYRNKNANMYNVFEKVFMACGTGFGLGYSLTTDSEALIFNYSTLFTLDMVALFMRVYYAYMNNGIDVRVVLKSDMNDNGGINENGMNENGMNNNGMNHNGVMNENGINDNGIYNPIQNL